MKKKTIQIRGNNAPIIIGGENVKIYIQGETPKKEFNTSRNRSSILLKWIKGFFVILATFFSSNCS
jgi:hypothetical protein